MWVHVQVCVDIYGVFLFLHVFVLYNVSFRIPRIRTWRHEIEAHMANSIEYDYE